VVSFADQIEEVDALLLETLGDGTATYLDRQGSVIAEALPVEVQDDIERPNMESGLLDRLRTVTVQKRRLQPFDRQGAFRMDGKTWHIDGIHEDDGHLITFYVVP
jgi:hypothetical protein